MKNCNFTKKGFYFEINIGIVIVTKKNRILFVCMRGKKNFIYLRAQGKI